MHTAVLRRVSRYTGMSFMEILGLPYSFFMLLIKESWVDSYMQTKQGRDILKDLWRLKQTGADLQAVHRFQKRGEK